MTGLILLLQESQLHHAMLFSGILDIFPIQGSALPCEQVFSSTKETTIACWNWINTNPTEVLQMLKFLVKQDQGLSGPALPHSHVPLKGRYDTSYSISRRIMKDCSHWTLNRNTGMVYWLNVDNLGLLRHNINYAVSSIPGLNKYFLLVFIYILIHLIGRLGC